MDAVSVRQDDRPDRPPLNHSVHVSFNPGHTMESVLLIGLFAYPLVLLVGIAVLDRFFEGNVYAKHVQESLDSSVESVRQRESLAGKAMVVTGFLIGGLFLAFMAYALAIMVGGSGSLTRRFGPLGYLARSAR